MSGLRFRLAVWREERKSRAQARRGGNAVRRRRRKRLVEREVRNRAMRRRGIK